MSVKLLRLHRLEYRLLFLLTFLLPFTLLSQGNPDSTWVTLMDPDEISSGRIENYRFTAIVAKSSKNLGPSIPVRIGGEDFDIPLDPDAPDFTYFLSPGISGELEFPFDLDQQVLLYLINTGKVPELIKSGRADDNPDCVVDFESVPQATWRQGLPSPTYSRISTSVNHVVIHHSAGSNTNSDFTQVVRDIYTYHTQVNGWSDIGYNYLVAQDGTIYGGRDPGNSIAQDNVMGAHFCAANRNTMGICLLGNYEEVPMSDESYRSLLSIVSWKLEKETLDPFDNNLHPLGNLEAVIGHRDGCSTLCPGENVYQRMDQIKTDVLNLLNCNNPTANHLAFAANNTVLESGNSITVENLSSGYDNYEWFFEGGVPQRATWYTSGQVKYNYPGIFDILLIGSSEGLKDTLLISDYIEVEGKLVVFPNPVSANGYLAMQYHEEIRDVELYGSEGHQISLRIDMSKDGIILPVLKPGLYLLRIATADEIIVRKILIE